MFGLAAGLYNAYLAPAKLSILLVGVDGAGKTSLLERVKVTRFSSRGESIPGGGNGLFSRRHSDMELAYGDSRLQAGTGELSPNSSYRHCESMQEGPSAAQKRKMRLFCPAPPSYWPSSTVSGDDDVIFVPNDQGESNETSTPERNVSNGDAKNGLHTKPKSPIGTSAANGEKLTGGMTNVSEQSRMLAMQQQKQKRKEYVADSDLRKGAKIFPLHMVRPTSGMNIGKVEMCGCKVNFWDLGGAEKMRILWERYYADADAVVFVVDSVSSRSKLEEARDAFFHIMDKEVLDGVPILVFATKADLIGEEGEAVAVDDESKTSSPKDEEDLNGEDDDSPSCLTFEEMAELFELSDDGALRTYDTITFRQGSAKTGEGVKAAFEWLIPRAKQIQRNRGRNS